MASQKKPPQTPKGIQITLGGEEHLVAPMNIVQSIRLLNIVKAYLARSGEIVRAFRTTEEELTVYDRISGVLASFNAAVPDDVFEHDVMMCISLLSGIPREKLETVEAEEFIDVLPTIVEASHFPALLSKLWFQATKAAPTAQLDQQLTDTVSQLRKDLTQEPAQEPAEAVS